MSILNEVTNKQEVVKTWTNEIDFAMVSVIPKKSCIREDTTALKTACFSWVEYRSN
jgi:hypothetical protein